MQKNAEYIADKFSLDEKYRTVLPSKKQKSNLPKYKALASKSKLETFHPVLSNFANCGTNRHLVDDLGLAGTAHYNRCVRERIRIDEMDGEMQSRIPYDHRGIPLDNNDTVKTYINSVASKAGFNDPVFNNFTCFARRQRRKVF